jgi:hypothetical protein
MMVQKTWALQAAEKGQVLGENPGKLASGPKGPIDFVGFIAGTKVPAYPKTSFSQPVKPRFHFVVIRHG